MEVHEWWRQYRALTHSSSPSGCSGHVHTGIHRRTAWWVLPVGGCCQWVAVCVQLKSRVLLVAVNKGTPFPFTP